MKKILLPLVALAFATPAAAQSIVVTGSGEDGLAPVSVAYEELKAGQNSAAVDKLEHSALDAQDPSRLINLGTAYARLGKKADAQTAYQAAITSPIRYDVELAGGTYMDSRWAARTALANLNQGGPLLALAR
jgi:cytochrome c-type biogenesis protein CcmH/NrfG